MIKRIMNLLLATGMSVCLFLSFGFLYDVDLTSSGGTIEVNLTEEESSSEDPGEENGEDSGGEDENGEENGEDENREDPEGSEESEENEEFENYEDEEELEDPENEDESDGDKLNYYHIVTNSNNGGYIDFEGNNSLLSGQEFEYSFYALDGYTLAWLRIGNQKIYPSDVDSSAFNGTFDNNLTIHAHFKKDAEIVTEDEEDDSGDPDGDEELTEENQNQSQNNNQSQSSNHNQNNNKHKEKENNGKGRDNKEK